MDNIIKPEGYICPFHHNDCLHLSAFSNSDSVICNHCENLIWEMIIVEEVKIFNLGFQTPLIMLYTS